MASLSLFLIERHSSFWLLRLLFHRSNQSKLPTLTEWNGENVDGHRLTCQLLEGFMVFLNFPAILSVNQIALFKGFLSDFVEITSSVHTKTIILFNLGEEWL